MALLCGATAAAIPAASAEDQPEAPAELAALAAPSIAGRWSGTTHTISADPSRCGPDGCTLTIDISPCGDAWCGVEVGKDGGCKGEALSLKSGKEADLAPNVFRGKLTLDASADDYVVEAVLLTRQGEPRRLSFIGDTGPELMIFRRSFPFHAQLAASGEAQCKSESPLS